jgi:hypothetical protein
MGMAHVKLQPPPPPQPLALSVQTCAVAEAEHAAAQAPPRTHTHSEHIRNGHGHNISPLPLHHRRRYPLNVNAIRFGNANAPMSPLLSTNNKKGDRSGVASGTQGQIAMQLTMQIQSPQPLLSLPQMTPITERAVQHVPLEVMHPIPMSPHTRSLYKQWPMPHRRPFMHTVVGTDMVTVAACYRGLRMGQPPSLPMPYLLHIVVLLCTYNLLLYRHSCWSRFGVSDISIVALQILSS